MSQDADKAVAAVQAAERALNEALRDLALEGIKVRLETGEATAVNGFTRHWVKVRAWRETNLL